MKLQKSLKFTGVIRFFHSEYPEKFRDSRALIRILYTFYSSHREDHFISRYRQRKWPQHSIPMGRYHPPSRMQSLSRQMKCRSVHKKVEELDFNKFAGRPITVDDLLSGMNNMGFQASSIGEAVRIINDMRAWRDPETSDRTTIFLGYTSNLISSGLRGTLRYLAQHRHVSAIVTTAGGVEEDIIKCLGPTYMGSFSTPGADLRAKGQNRIGNLIVPNNNYCAFEDWVMPILDTMLSEQEESKKDPNTDNHIHWTPTLTDGSLGDMLYFHTFKSSPAQLRIDLVEDIRKINTLAVRAKRAGMIILGGGVVKHHIANACLMRNGAESAVYINTAQEFDGSDAGARPDEAVSWGKIKVGADSVKVYVEATACFPLIVAGTFAKDQENSSSVASKKVSDN
ncbi:hypothetical protein EYC84_001755 [Monilinia fructicola]|uniref:deoxyhypusine synthase n=1 Tax=Monilinia fructicola TaxID=38448 RepID=A0A5M9JV73_MONFR|nr:hypothetical protein EYC84_001755 [Monilinia fructicola]